MSDLLVRTTILGTAAVVSTAALAVLKGFVSSRPQVFCLPTDRNRRLLDACTSLVPFSPAWWCASGFVQTIAAGILRQTPEVEFYREHLHTEDGGTIALDWCEPTHVIPRAAPVVIVLHGLTGGSQEPYVRFLVQELDRRGWRVVVFNARGCGNTELSSPHLVCAAYTDDLRLVAEHVRKETDDAPVFGIGFSLGANILTKYVGESGEECLLTGACSVSNPYDLARCNVALASQPLLDRKLGSSLGKLAKKHESMLRRIPAVDVDKGITAASILEFDSAITAPAFGYSTVWEYYQAGSSARVLEGARRPLLLLSAVDDPLSTKQAIPFQAPFENPHVVLATTAQGGHVAWLEGFWPSADSWADRVVTDFLGAALKETCHINHDGFWRENDAPPSHDVMHGHALEHSVRHLAARGTDWVVDANAASAAQSALNEHVIASECHVAEQGVAMRVLGGLLRVIRVHI